MRVEKRLRTWETLLVPEQNDDEKRRVAGHTASESTHGETLTQVGRSLNYMHALSDRLFGKAGSTERRAADDL